MTQLATHRPPTLDELAEVITRYAAARQLCERVSRVRPCDRPADPVKAFDELEAAEATLLYAGRLLARYSSKQPAQQPAFTTK